MAQMISVMEGLERFNERVGRLVAWLVLGCVLITFSVAVLRYGFNFGRVWLQESYIWCHALVFMLASGYALKHDSHVRVDVFYRPASERHKAWVNLLGSIFLLLPTLAMVAWMSWPYVLLSWSRLEGSGQANGLPGVFLLKSALILFALFLTLQGLALALRSLLVLKGAPGVYFDVPDLEYAEPGDAKPGDAEPGDPKLGGRA